MTIIALCGCLTFGYSCFDITVMVLKPSPRIKRNSERGGMYTLRASFPAPSSKHCQNWLRHSRGTPLSPRRCLYEHRQHPPKGLGIYTYTCVKTTGIHQGHPSSFAFLIILSPSSDSGPSVSGPSAFETAKAKTDGTGGYPQDGKALRRRAHPS